MTPTLLHAVARKADALTPDAELLARYRRDRDGAAFEELVRRHGPLVWSACRQMLPERADAEDAFQAVFLALVRSADRIRDGRALPAWLHGVAVRVAARARRGLARRRARERAAAVPEADRPVPDAAWEALAAAVHDEVRRLPEAERTAFVLCELQGVSQAEAAARLGWPLGSLSGRLCKARKRLLGRLASRGIAPAAAVGVGVAAGAAGAVPPELFAVVASFPGSPGAASVAASALARGVVGGLAMRAKLTAAILVAAFGLTGGAVWLSQADAQPPGAKPAGPPADPFGAPGAPGTPPAGGPVAYTVKPREWEYKFADVAADRKEFEKAITQHGKDGWEYCGSEPLEKLEWNTGAGARPKQLVLVFKRPKGGPVVGGMAPAGPGGAPGLPGAPTAPGAGPPVPRPGPMVPVGVTPAPVVPTSLQVYNLRNAKADELATVLKKLYPNVDLTGDPRTNALIVRADTETQREIISLLQQLDGPADKPKK